MPEFAPAVPRFFPEASFTQQDILRLFDRLLPDYYLQPLKSPGPGYEYLQAVAKMTARLSEAAAHMATGSFVGSATGGRRAYATVEISRNNSVFGAVTLLKGTLVSTDDGYLYQTLADISFGASEIGAKLVEVEATARGWDWNKPGPITAANGELVEGSITRLASAVVPSAGLFDPTLQVRQVSPTINAPHTLSASFAQPAVGAVVQLDLNTTQDTPRVGATLYIGTAIDAQDEYVVESVLSVSPYESRVRLISAGLNAVGTVVPAGTSVYMTSDAYGGESMMLDGLGIDKGVYRNNVLAQVSFALTSPASSTVTFMPGTRVKTADNYLYQLIDSVNFATGTVGPQTARAIPVVLPDEYASHGAITAVDLIKWGSPAYGDTITVTQLRAYSQEGDEAYRARVALLPYVVTPNAVQHLLDQVVGAQIKQAGQTYSWREVWDIRFQSTYSENSWLSADPHYGPNDFPLNQTFTEAEIAVPVDPYSSNIFVYVESPEDHAAAFDPLSNRYMGTAGMIVFALPKGTGDEYATLYAGLAELLDNATAVGIPLGYVFS